MDNDAFAMSLPEVVDAFIDEKLMENVGEILNDAQVTIGTVHHSLAFMIVDDLCNQAESLDGALAGLLSLQHFMYIIASQMAYKKFKRSEH